MFKYTLFHVFMGVYSSFEYTYMKTASEYTEIVTFGYILKRFFHIDTLKYFLQSHNLRRQQRCIFSRMGGNENQFSTCVFFDQFDHDFLCF